MEITQKRRAEVQKIERLIGHTPLYELPPPFSTDRHKISIKLEWQQLGQSVKARPAYSIIKSALARDLLQGKTLVDASSGNTGIAYASIGSALNIPVRIFLPENASEERKRILRILGAETTYTSPLEGTDGAQIEAKSTAQERPDLFFYADQYNNPANVQAHYRTTAPEIFKDAPDITHFTCGLGTGGSFSGISKYFSEEAPAVECIGLQPDTPMHILEGWKHLETATRPGILDLSKAKETLEVSSEKALALIPDIAKKTGLLLSPSAAANILGALAVRDRIAGGHIVTLATDDLSKYSEIAKQIHR